MKKLLLLFMVIAAVFIASCATTGYQKGEAQDSGYPSERTVPGSPKGSAY